MCGSSHPSRINTLSQCGQAYVFFSSCKFCTSVVSGTTSIVSSLRGYEKYKYQNLIGEHSLKWYISRWKLSMVWAGTSVWIGILRDLCNKAFSALWDFMWKRNLVLKAKTLSHFGQRNSLLPSTLAFFTAAFFLCFWKKCKSNWQWEKQGRIYAMSSKCNMPWMWKWMNNVYMF